MTAQPTERDRERAAEVREIKSRCKVTVDGCWEWPTNRDHRGYGRQNRYGRVHRYTFALVNGPIPDGYEIDHMCENPPCVNPAHLQALTRLEHACITQARAGKDELHRAAAELRSSGASLAEIAEQLDLKNFGSAHSAIKYAVRKGLIPEDALPAKPRRYTAEEADRFLELHLAGLSYREVGRRLGTTGGVARKVILRQKRAQEALCASRTAESTPARVPTTLTAQRGSEGE